MIPYDFDTSTFKVIQKMRYYCVPKYYLVLSPTKKEQKTVNRRTKHRNDRGLVIGALLNFKAILSKRHCSQTYQVGRVA